MPDLRPPPGEPPNLTTALKYARRGFRIFPCSPEKRPLLDDWLNVASADENQITEWWNKTPEALIGLPCKHLDLLVIDLDRHTPDQDGINAFNQMIAGHGPLPEHPVIQTPNAGEHHIFKQPSGFKIGNRTVMRGIDTRGYRLENAGGYVIGPGSILPDGRSWKPAKGSPPFLATLTKGLVEIPAGLADRLREKEVPQTPPVQRSAGKNEEAWSLAALNRIASDVAGKQPGTGRDNALVSAAGTMGRMVKAGWIGYATVEGRLLDACIANKLLAEVGEPKIRDKIKRAVEAVSPHEPLVGKPPDMTRATEGKKNDGNAPTPTERNADNSEIARLANLSTIDYERQREASADKLGMTRVTMLDAAVREHRKANKKASDIPVSWTVQPALDEVDGGQLLDAIKAILERYVVLPPHTADAIALWNMHSWTINSVDISPILGLISPEKRCGKTTVLKLLNRLACRAEIASNISTAALFRYINAHHPTLLIDEADTFLRDNEEMRGVLNSGHSREAAYVIRCEGDDMTPRKFGTWGAKAIAAIKRLPSTLTDRSITVPMRRKLKTEKRPRYRDYDREEFKHLRSKALRWANDSERSLPDDPPVPDALDDRSADNWRPLIAIANLAGGDWPEAARKAALALSGVGDDTEGVRLLRDIKWIFSGKPAKAEGTEEAVIEEEPVDRMFSIDLVGHLIGIEGSPWADWPKKGFTQTALADLLEPYGTRPATVRIGTKTLKGYMLASFREAFDAYLGEAEPVPPPPGGNLAVTPSQPNKDGANSQTLAVTQKNPVTADKLQKPATNGHCYGVTGKSTPEALSEALVTPVGEIAANGFGISSSPEERKPLEPGQVCCRVRIREIRHPKISCGPTDSLDDFVAL